MRGSRRLVARRAIARWAVRLLRREWRQQMLVAAVLTVAVAASVFAASAAYNTVPSRDAEFGSASHRFRFNIAEPAVLDAFLAAAADWFGVIDVIGHRQVPVPGSVEAVEIRSQDPQGSYGPPMLALRDGRFPSTSSEVALTDTVAATLGAVLGETVPIGAAPLTVVGLVENPADLDDEFALVAPSSDRVPEAVTILVRDSGDRAQSFTFADEPGSGFVEARGDTEKATAAVLVLVVSTVAMLLVALIAAAGFVVVAQRRMRQLGMLAAVGATERHLRLVMLVNGAAVGLFAGLVGTASAIAGWATVASRFESAAGHRIDRLDVPWWVIAVVMLLAIVTASGAAWWPARSVSRVPITRALSGRPPRARPVHRSAVAALLLLAAGAACLAFGIDPTEDHANPLLLLGGVVATVLAVLLVAPPAVRALATFGTRSPLALRLALRDLARYQARAGAALAAIALGVGIAVSVVVAAAAATYGADEGNLSDRQVLVHIGAGDERDNVGMPLRTGAEHASLAAVVDRLAGTLDAPTVVPLEVAVDPAITERRDLQTLHPPVVLGRRVGPGTTRDSGLVYVATPEVLDHLGVDQSAIGSDTMLLTTQAGDVYLTGNISNTSFRRDPVPSAEVVRIGGTGHSSSPRALITPYGLRAGGWQPTAAGWIVESRQPLTGEQLVAAREIASDAGLVIESRRTQQGLETIRSVASGAGVLLALGILAMTVGLIRGEAAGDLRTLTAAGSTSSIRRALAASTAGALAVLAVVVGITAAYVALTAGYWPDAGRLTRVPVPHLAAIAVGIPGIATAAGWLLAGREPTDVTRSPVD